MGEIDRINPILRPLLQPKLTDRVQPSDADKRGQHQQGDSVELGNRPTPSEDEETEDGSQEPPPQAEHGLDLSI